MSVETPSPLSRRRGELLETTAIRNGIDYVEVDPTDHRLLTVGLIHPMPVTGPWNLDADPSRARVTGGERIRAIRTMSVTVVDPRTLRVTVDVPGDFSPYELELDVPDLDPVLRRTTFSFMAACPSDLDCETPCREQAVEEDEPLLDTLAKDYGSFRQMLLDLAAQRHPSLSDRHAADVGVTLLELLAFHGDELSYQQDAVFAEATFDTARRRVSVRRHARLVDYVLHEGRNAWTAVHVQVTRNVTIAGGTRLFTRIPAALPGATAAPGTVVDAALVTAESLAVPPLAETVVFETAHALVASPLGNAMHLHHWGDDEFWLPAGATAAWLWSEDPAAPGQAAEPPLAAGDRLVVEQVRNPATGDRVNIGPAQRWVFRVTETATGADPAYTDAFTVDADGQRILTPRTDPADPALPLLGVRWSIEESPARPVCVRAVLPGGEVVEDVALARGNVVLADHGCTYSLVDVTPDGWEPSQLAGTGDPGEAALRPPLRLRLPDAPLTFQVGDPDDDRDDLTGDATAARPALSLVVRPLVGVDEAWRAVPDLLDSGPDEGHVVVEVDDGGRALLRFGDGVLGRRPLDARAFLATYRVGNGTAGLVGAEALVHVALPAADASAVAAVRNPVPARAGTDPEPIERARQLAPDAYRIQRRAVVEEDVVAAVLGLASVRAAVAALRWTGTWYTWLVAVLPRDPADLVDTGGTRQELAPALRAEVTGVLDGVRLAGHDVAVHAPWFAPVDLALHVCVAPGFRRGEVRVAVRDALLAPVLPGGGTGLLAASSLTFGRALLLGDVYAAVANVPGVESVKATRLRRYEQPDNGELAAGRLRVAPWEVPRLDDDPSLPGRGVLRLDLDGGMP